MRMRLLGGLVAGALLLAAPAAAEVRLGALPMAPHPAPEALEPGLRATYAHAYFNHIDEMTGWERTVAGKPVRQLATRASGGPVLTSAETEGVGAMLDGYLHLARPGSWRFKVNSNDGVRIHLGGRLLYEDPFRHAARMSDELVVEVAQPGWHALKVGFYQAKGDWTLELFWQPPGTATPVYVPAEAFAHAAKTVRADPMQLAREEAERILQAARDEAAAILAAARKEAERIVGEAGKKPSN